jgi:hypothetical protein
LTRRDITIKWRAWLGLEWTFRQIVAGRRKLSSPGDKLLFAELAFILIDDTRVGPLFRRIERLSIDYRHVRNALTATMRMDSAAERDDLSILGSGQGDCAILGNLRY